MAASIWSSVAVAVESARAGAVSISAISKANPGVVTTGSAHGYSNGDFILISAQGMSQVDSRVFRITGASGSVFNLEGEDTTNYGTFTSGNAYKLTFGTTLATLVGLSASGGTFEMIDTTTIHDNVKKQIPGVASPSVYSFESMWDVSDTGLVAMKSYSDQQAQKAIRFTFANSQKFLFLGYIGATLLPTGNAQDLVKTSVEITGYGKPTVYST